MSDTIDYRLFDLLNGGKGIALGKIAEKEGLECNLDTTFLKTPKIYGNIELNGTLLIQQTEGSNVWQLRCDNNGQLKLIHSEKNNADTLVDSIDVININPNGQIDQLTGKDFYSISDGTNGFFVNVSNINDEATSVSANAYAVAVEVHDSDNQRIGRVESSKLTDGKIGFGINASRLINGTRIYNSLVCNISNDGTLTYTISSPANFRASLGIQDYVTEQGTSGIWRYRKWASGIREAWGQVTNATTPTTSEAGGYKTGNVTPSAFPSGLFTARPKVFCTIYTENQTLVAVNQTTPSTTSAGTWFGYRINSNASDRTKTFVFYAVQS